MKKLDDGDDSDNESTVVKTGEELLKIDLDNDDTLLNKKRIFYWAACNCIDKRFGSFS